MRRRGLPFWLVLIVLAAAAHFNGKLPRTNSAAHPMPVITGTASRHILYGNGNGGGHLHGQGKACKSEFPASWDARKVLDAVQRQAANDNIPWQQESNGYYVGEAQTEGVVIRIVLNRDKSEVVTAYPLNTRRNACDTSR